MDKPANQVSNGSGTEHGYSVEVRSDTSFVAWEWKGYECGLTPQAEFVIGNDWKKVPTINVPSPYGIVKPGLSDHAHFANAARDLVSYDAALAIKASILANMRYRPNFEIRIKQHTFTYSYTELADAEAPESNTNYPHFTRADEVDP